MVPVPPRARGLASPNTALTQTFRAAGRLHRRDASDRQRHERDIKEALTGGLAVSRSDHASAYGHSREDCNVGSQALLEERPLKAWIST